MSDNDVKPFSQITSFTGLAAKEDLSFERYRFLLRHSVWMAIARIVKDIRAFQEGISGSQTLIEFTEVNKADLSETEYRSNLVTLYGFLLESYFALEDWESYIKLWETLRTRNDLHSTYALSAERSEVHRDQIGPFILGRTETQLVVHFLYYKHRRLRQSAQEYFEKQKLGLDHKKVRRNKKILTPEEINFRIQRGLLFCERGLKLEKAREMYLKDEIPSTQNLYAILGEIFGFFDRQYEELKETREPEFQRPPVKNRMPWSRETNETVYARRVKAKRQEAARRKRAKK